MVVNLMEKLKMLIAISTYLKPTEEVEKHRPEHHKFIKPLFENGTLLVSGRQSPPVGAVLIARMTKREDFQKVLDSDPFVKAGVAEYKIIEFNPAFHDEAFGVLLKSID